MRQILTNDPSIVQQVEVLDLEFHGAAEAFDQEGTPVVTLLFRPIGSDAVTVEPKDLVQIAVDKRNIAGVVRTIQKMYLDPTSN